MKWLKNFLCTTDPANLTGGFVLFIVLSVEAWAIGLKTFLLLIVVGVAAVAVLVAVAYGLYRLIKHLQTKCVQESE